MKKATSRKGATKSKESAKPPRESSKTAQVVAMLQRPEGATLSEIMASMGWQKHTVRGFVSLLGSKGGEKIESSKNASGERTYRITK